MFVLICKGCYIWFSGHHKCYISCVITDAIHSHKIISDARNITTRVLLSSPNTEKICLADKINQCFQFTATGATVGEHQYFERKGSSSIFWRLSKIYCHANGCLTTSGGCDQCPLPDMTTGGGGDGPELIEIFWSLSHLYSIFGCFHLTTFYWQTLIFFTL